MIRRMLSPPSPNRGLRFSSERVPIISSTVMVLVRQPTTTAKADTMVKA